MSLAQVDLHKSVGKEEYERELPELQIKMRDLSFHLYRQRISLILVFEGWDAAGKGGNIKRIIEKLDPRAYKVIGIKAPNDEEASHHYLWRFWRHIPKGGHIVIYDRSWYGRVLVERVEGFCAEEEWRRAYQEINEFEENHYNFGTIILKFWIHIDRDTQEQRFLERKSNPFKRWKITEEDWRNRDKWDDYLPAVEDMLKRTSTSYAPWHIIPGTDKLYARLATQKLIIRAIESRLKDD